MTNLQVAILSIRAWVERGSSVPMRARIHFSNSFSRGSHLPKTVTTPEAGGEVVKEWLEEVVADDKRAEALERDKKSA